MVCLSLSVCVCVCGGSLCGVVVGLVVSLDLKYHRNRTRPTHQYSFRVGKVRKALRHDADYFVVYLDSRRLSNGSGRLAPVLVSRVT